VSVVRRPDGRLDRRTLLRGTGAAGLVLGLGAATAVGAERTSAGQGATTDLTVAGGELYGSFTRFARLLAGELRGREGMGRVSVTSSAGSVANLALLRAGEADLALALADSLAEDRTGVAAVARLYQTTLHCLVRADSPIRSVADLSGRLIAVGMSGSGTEETAQRLLCPRIDLALRPATQTDGAIALAGGRVDAMLWWGGQPSPELASLSRTHPLRAIDLGELVDAEVGAGSAYQSVRLPSDVWGQADDVRTAGVAVLLLCRTGLGDGAVRTVIDTLFTAKAQLVPQPSGGLQYLAPASLIDTFPADLHPAAVERYRQRHG